MLAVLELSIIIKSLASDHRITHSLISVFTVLDAEDFVSDNLKQHISLNACNKTVINSLPKLDVSRPLLGRLPVVRFSYIRDRSSFIRGR